MIINLKVLVDMKKNIISGLLILFHVPFCLFAQTEGKDNLNQLNAYGQKEGLWCEVDSHSINYTYYKNGTEDGISYTIMKDSHLLRWFVKKKEGKYVELYFFSDDGHLEMTLLNFQDNFLPVPKSRRAYLGEEIPPFSCNYKLYYPNSHIKEEGILLSYDEPIFESCEYGEWKYYNEEGELYEIKIYGDTITVLHPGDAGWHE